MANTDYLSGDTTVFSNISLNGDGRMAVSRLSSTATIAANAVWASSVSIGGANLPASISATSFLVVAQVVQGSASSFTVCATVTSVQKGDILVANPFGGAGVSSISSGLVWTSHATQNGQFEFRYSNVSTLVQNQSAQSFNLAIIRL
jgi:hypothetical protein